MKLQEGKLGSSQDGTGVYGKSENGFGVHGVSPAGIGIYGEGDKQAGWFSGDVRVTGQLVVGSTKILAYIHRLEARILHLEREVNFMTQAEISLYYEPNVANEANPWTLSGGNFTPSGEVDIIATNFSHSRVQSLTAQSDDAGHFDIGIESFGEHFIVEATDVASGLSIVATVQNGLEATRSWRQKVK